MTFFTHPTEVDLAIADRIQAASWQQGQSFAIPIIQRHVYHHRVCLDTILPWVQAEYGLSADPWHAGAEMPGVWSLVDGAAIVLGQKKLVLLPNQTLDTSELRIPQEWVDIPSWAADYFVAVQVNPDQPSLRLWGYTTHEQVKQVGVYDPDDRTYCLDADDLVADLSLLWVTQQRYPNAVTQSAIAPLASIPAIQAENLLQRLANPDLLAPRLELPFVLWGALLEQPNLRQRLCQGRLNLSSNPNRVNLRQWLQSVFDPAWQAIEALVNADPQLAFNIRQTTDANDALIRRVQPIQVITSTVDQPVMLVVSIEAEPDDRMGIQIQLYAATGDLPANLEFTMRSSADSVIQSVQTRDQDDSIQLRRFKCAVGAQFAIQIRLDDFYFSEVFVG